MLFMYINDILFKICIIISLMYCSLIDIKILMFKIVYKCYCFVID